MNDGVRRGDANGEIVRYAEPCCVALFVITDPTIMRGQQVVIGTIKQVKPGFPLTQLDTALLTPYDGL
jgi:hypothetical protein